MRGWSVTPLGAQASDEPFLDAVKEDLDPHLKPVAARSLEEEERAFLFFIETEVCTFDPRSMDGWPLGQMRCPVCVNPVMCGIPHMGFGRPIELEWYTWSDEITAFLGQTQWLR